jgi:DNA-binding response OmpR family regulator
VAEVRILVVEDDLGIASGLDRALTAEHYVVDIAPTGAEALRLALHEPASEPDLVLLDLGLPDHDGLEVCRQILEARPSMPVIVLTARAQELDVVAGLDAGAVDYVTKPFRLAELLARIRAQLRRVEPQRMTIGPLEVDTGARRAWFDGHAIELRAKEFDLLAALVANAGRVMHREELMRDVWDENYFGSTKTLDVHMAALRRKLGQDRVGPGSITTLRGVGYRLERS